MGKDPEVDWLSWLQETLGAHSPGPVLGPASWTRRHLAPHVSRTDPCNKTAAGLTIREIAT